MADSSGHVQIVPGRNDRGEDVFSVLVKRSYRVADGRTAERSEVDQAFRMIDEYYDDGDPDWSTVKYESELAPFKSAIDVVVIGKAHAPNAAPAQRMTVSVAVGGQEKTLVVTGDRECHHRDRKAPVFSDPQPFLEMEIRYDFAYGGRDEKSDPNIPFHYPRNSMGKGLALRNVREVVEGLRLPNVEDPDDLLTPERVIVEDPMRWHLQPVPQGFGWRQRTWYPRCALLGAWPAFLAVGTVTAEERMGLLPQNHVALAKQGRLAPREAEFNNGASLGLAFESLQGDERVALRGLSPAGTLEFGLPGDAPEISLDLGEGLKTLETRMHTISIRPEDLEIDIIWRGAQSYPGVSWLPNLKRLHAEVQ
jgi:hypothetical protein